MRLKYRVFLLGAGTCLTSVNLVSQQVAFPTDSAIRAILKQRVDDRRSAGIVVGVLEPDGRTRIIAYGDAGPGQPPLDENSVFEIGSISKVFTATVLAQLVREGRVQLDDPVQKFLPATAHLPTRNGKEITIGSLSMQNSGLPPMPSNFHPSNAANPYPDYSAAQMYEFLSAYQLTRDPGATFEYSNLGVGFLGHVLARIAGTSYEDMESARVWTPLGMTHTAITLTPWMRQHLALGHGQGGGVVSNWDFAVLEGAGAIRSTASDMLKFADANLHPERGALQQAMRFAQQERTMTTLPNAWIGLNWISQHIRSDTVVWHNGGTGGYTTFLGLHPATKRAVVVLSNTGGSSVDDIGMHLLVPMVPLTAKVESPRQRTAIDVAAPVLAKYAGAYQLAPTFIITITAEGNELHLQATGQPRFRLWAETETDFFLKEVDAQVTFERDASGVATSLVLHQNGQNVPGAKVKP